MTGLSKLHAAAQGILGQGGSMFVYEYLQEAGGLKQSHLECKKLQMVDLMHA
jgi:hypothetical protein